MKRGNNLVFKMMKMKPMPKFDFILSVAVTLTTLLLCFDFIGAERDFNFNDSQVPLLEPKDEPPHSQRNHNKNNQDPYAAEVSHCHYADSEIILSLILKNHDWHDLGDNKKAKVLEKFSKFFAIPKEFIKMESVTKRELNEMQKESLRKGHNKCHSNRRLGRVNLMIGCGATFFTVAEPIVNQIGAQMKDGSIDNIIGEKFGLWIIWRKHYKTGAQRNRRQIEGSGEDDYDGDDYDYDDDDEEVVETVTEIPAPAPAVTMHAHRHHHGDGGQPELTENKLDLVNNNLVAAAAAGSATTDTDDTGASNAKSDDSSLLLLNKKNNIDEEIVESVSQLESVITKTIENTKNIKDLSVIDGEAVEEVVAEEEGEEAPVPVEIEKELEQPARGGVLLEEFDNELEQRRVIEKQGGINLNHVHETTPKTKTTTSSSTTAAAANASGTTKATETTKQTFNINNVVNVDDDDDDDEVEENEDAALEASAPLNRNLNVNAAAINSLDSTVADGDNTADADAVINVAEVIESSSIATTATSAPPSSSTSSSSSSSSMSTLSAAVGLENISSATTHTNTNTSTVIAITPSVSTTTITPLPSSPYTPSFDASSSYSVSVVPSPSPSPLPSSTSFISSLSSSPSSSSSAYVSSTTTTTATTTATPITSVTTTLQTKDENEATTLLPDGNQDLGVKLTSLNGTRNDYDGTPTSSSSSSSSSAASSPSTILTTTPTSASAGDATTPTTASTDYLETKIENMPPMIRTRLQKFAVISGKSFTFTVPDDTFYDTEDNTNLRLELTDKEGHELKPSSWLQFNAETRQIYGLPLDDAVSKWQYRLSATDSGNETVTETLEMSVQQHRGVRTVNHEISVTVKINEKNMHNIYWQLKLMKAIASTLDDDTTNAIVVREIRPMPQDANTATFVYFNETLPTSGECPESELNNLVKHLDANRLSDLVYPTLGVKSITGQLIGACQKTHLTKPKPTTSMTKNQPPVLRNQVDRVNATVGHLLVFKVPSDTFYDPNDNELTLTLKTKDYKDLNPRHWLQFDSKNQEFYGIPKSGDVGSEEYLLIAEDSGGLNTNDALVVVVAHAPKREFSVYFKAYLAIQHEHFNADLQRKFVQRVSQLFGDQSTQYLQIRSVTTQHDADSTIVIFYNTTLYKMHNRCPDEEIEATRNVYFMQDHLVRDRVKKALGPELNLTNVQVVPFSSCHSITDVTHREFIPTKTDEPLLKSTFSEEYMYTFILPAVIILVMILVASIIACCLHRRRRKSGKMELGDEEERKSFRTKGIPVIFQDELDEKPEIGNKSPIILKDEKPPLLPPSYNTSNMNGDNDVDEYVPPPAVVVGGREARGKSPATPSYRKPPPYVSP